MPAKQPKRIFVKGNVAVALGAVAARCQCFFGYPITPQNDIPEYMSKLMPENGGEFVQAESEVAAANMLLGASACGIRSMTSSSSPGISLKQEAISYMAGSELPGVIVNMNRGGPGLGDIGPAQGDYYQSTRGGGHGDYRTLVLAPATCQEAYDLIIEAFDLAFKYRNPVLLLGDAILGQMMEPVTPWKPKKASDKAASWCLSGKGKRKHRLIKSLFLEEGALAGQNRHLAEKYKAMAVEARAESFMTKDADLVVVAYGSIGRIAKSHGAHASRPRDTPVGLVRPVTLYPFPDKTLATLAKQGKRFLTIEHNLGQMVDDVAPGRARHPPIRTSTGNTRATCPAPTISRSPSSRA